MWQQHAKILLEDILSQNQELRITSIVGAGAGVASGLKTFRGEEGLFQGKRPEELASRYGFDKDPDLVWGWYKKRMANVFTAKPNAIHTSLVRLERMGLLDKVITQNVDGLSRIAGQSESKLLEIHGTILRSHCLSNCGIEKAWSAPPDIIPVVCDCGSYQRPSVVWYGEKLDTGLMEEVEVALKNSNLLLIIGTSGLVYPVASFPQYAKQFGAKIIELNLNETPYANVDDLFIKGPAEATIEELLVIIGELVK